MGKAEEDKISRMADAKISSRSVIPASEEFLRRKTILPDMVSSCWILRLNLNRRLAGHQRYRLLLRVLGVYLHDGNIRRTRRKGLNHNAHDRSGSVHSRGVGLPRCGDNRLPVLLIHALHD